jgi:thiol-disulfide isomerase/thioredoxin
LSKNRTGSTRARRARLAAALLSATAWFESLKAEPAINEAAPPLTIMTARGQKFDLAILRGKVVLVDFWATWCAPCLTELPVIEKFYRKHHPDGFEVIALSTDRPRDRQKMQRLIAKLPFDAALLQDADRNGFGTPEAVPVSYVIDAQGIVRDQFIAIDDELLDEVVLPLLKNAAVKPVAEERP